MKKPNRAAQEAAYLRKNATMMRQDMESIYATVFLVHDMNRQHRDEMLRRAEHDRLVRLADVNRQRLTRTVLMWAGRRLVASGHYLLNRADRADGDLTLASIEG